MMLLATSARGQREVTRCRVFAAGVDSFGSIERGNFDNNIKIYT